MVQPGYPTAQYAASEVLPHLVQHREASAPVEGREPAALPDLETLAALIDTAFWASLRREEGYTPKLSLAYVSPEVAATAMRFDRPLRVLAAPLTKLAPAVERPGIHLGVWPDPEGLAVWGATRSLPAFCCVLETVAPGVLVIKQTRAEESGKFMNIAVIEAEQLKVIDQRASIAPDCPALLASLLGLATPFDPAESVNVLIQLATSMRAHGRGGLLLVVPSGSDAWQESVLTPITYAVAPKFTALAELLQVDETERPRLRWQDAVRRAVDGIAGLTAVDGATVIDDQHNLLAFGVKIVRRRGSQQVDRLTVTEPIEGSVALTAEPAYLGGTRHLSGAQFTHDQRDAIALVASQDGRFTVFGWSPCEDMVHAHRIETLLL
jgi:hypothetical protein